MEKKKTIFNIFNVIFAVLLIISGVCWFATNLIAFIGGLDSQNGGLITYLAIELVIGAFICFACVFVARRILVDIQGGKKSDERLLYCLCGIFSFDLAISAILAMAINNGWDQGYLWAKFIFGLAFLLFTIVCFLSKSNNKSIISTMLVSMMLAYFVYCFFAEATDPINVLQCLYGVLALVFAFAVAYFALPLFKKEKVEEPAQETEEKAE